MIRRQGKLVSHDTIDAARTALVVVDMQNYFVAEGFPLEVPLARDIVPNVNRLARAVRAAGGTVAWVQMTVAGALQHWANYHTHMLTPERVKMRLAHLDEAGEGRSTRRTGPSLWLLISGACRRSSPRPRLGRVRLRQVLAHHVARRRIERHEVIGLA